MDRYRGIHRRPKTPLLGSIEQWEIFNFTEDSHPIHLHLPQYQVLAKWHIDFLDQDENGIPDDTTGDGKISYGTGSSPDYSVADIWIGDEVALRPEETGWQDTVLVDPHQMMAIVSIFDKPGDYAWHCHILSHEDNEMMRPYTVVQRFRPDVIDAPSTGRVVLTGIRGAVMDEAQALMRKHGLGRVEALLTWTGRLSDSPLIVSQFDCHGVGNPSI